MKKIGFIVGLFIIALAVSRLEAITTNPASNVTADSANTALTIPYRDASGNFAAGTITATLDGPVSAVAQSVTISTSATSVVIMTLKGSYSSSEISLLSGKQGDIVFNSTVGTICVGSGTVATVGAYVYVSSSAATAKVVCGS